MKNLDYHPDTAHLPSPTDIIRWRFGGGWQKDKREKDKLRRVREKWDAAKKSQAQMLESLNIQP